MFIAAVVVAGMWDSIRKREAQHETVRRMIESGQPIDEAMADRLLQIARGDAGKDTGRDLRTGGWITLALAPGLAIFGWIMGRFLAIELFYIMLAVAALMFFISVGLFTAAVKVYGDKTDSP